MGIEPTTFRLQSECSTTKLKEHKNGKNKHIIYFIANTQHKKFIRHHSTQKIYKTPTLTPKNLNLSHIISKYSN